MTSPRNPTTTITVVSVFLLTTHPLTCSPSGHPAQRTGHPAGYFGPGCTFYALAPFCAAAAGNGLYDLYLFAGTGVLDKVPDVDDAIVASVGALQAGVVRLYGVVVLGGWVRWCARLLCAAHGVPTS